MSTDIVQLQLYIILNNRLKLIRLYTRIEKNEFDINILSCIDNGDYSCDWKVESTV